jgi:hypothetical protein
MDKLSSLTNCAICAQPLVYASDARAVVCHLCGKENRSLIYCPAGHYVCDACHSRSAVNALRQLLAVTREKDPGALLEEALAHPSVSTHGPEHHVMVPAVIVAAARNAGFAPDAAVDKAIDRASKVPGGWCGLYGDCGAAVGLGIAVSVITGATPLTGPPRTLAMRATSFALSRMLDNQARCCKRASRTAVKAAVQYMAERLDMVLPYSGPARCSFTSRNAECPKELCPFFAGGPSLMSEHDETRDVERHGGTLDAAET